MSRGDPTTCPIVCRALRLAHNMAAIEAWLWASCSPAAEHSESLCVGAETETAEDEFGR